jgi:branched-chain amino acid aminotransferase
VYAYGGKWLLSVRVYCLTSQELRVVDQTGPTLDAVSLRLPHGAYTTLRTYDTDRIIGLSAHLQRLIESSQLLQRPYPIDPAAIRSALRDVIARERQPALRVRLTVPLDADQIYISVEPFEMYPPEFYQHGVRCATTRLSRHTPRAKSTDFIAASRESKAALDPGIHELLMVDSQGHILEGISSNFYAVCQGVLRTAEEGVLAGITRSIVLQEAAATVPIDYRPVRVSDLAHVTEAFITSSSREVMPVIQIDTQIIGAGQPGPIAQALLEKYRAYLARSAETV